MQERGEEVVKARRVTCNSIISMIFVAIKSLPHFVYMCKLRVTTKHSNSRESNLRFVVFMATRRFPVSLFNEEVVSICVLNALNKVFKFSLFPLIGE